MRDQLRSFLIGFLGWYLLLVVRAGAWLAFLPVLIASGFAGGLALIWWRSGRSAAARA